MNNEYTVNLPKYSCEYCDFICSKQSDWNRHIARPKHELNMKTAINGNVKTSHDNKFHCKCGNSYTFTTGLSRHKKLCKMMNTKDSSVTQNVDESFTHKASLLPTGTDSRYEFSQSHRVDISNKIVETTQFSNELLYNLLKEISVSNAKNDEFKNMVIQQNVKNDELKSMVIQQNAQLLELVQKNATDGVLQNVMVERT